MSDTLLSLTDVGLRRHGNAILENINLQVRRGEIVTLIGPNGAGKTSLVRIVLGLLRADNGEVHRDPRLRIGYMPQKLQIDATLPLDVLRFLLLAPKVNRSAALQALGEVGATHLAQRPLQLLVEAVLDEGRGVPAVVQHREGGVGGAGEGGGAVDEPLEHRPRAGGRCERPDRALSTDYPTARPLRLRCTDGVPRPASGDGHHRYGGVPEPACVLPWSPGQSEY